LHRRLVGFDGVLVESDEVLVELDEGLVESNGRLIDSDERPVDLDEGLVGFDERPVDLDERPVGSAERLMSSTRVSSSPTRGPSTSTRVSSGLTRGPSTLTRGLSGLTRGSSTPTRSPLALTRVSSGLTRSSSILTRGLSGLPRGSGEGLASHPTVAAIRALFRAAGCDPTRYRPSSEALLRRLLKGEELPVIHPFVDLNNCLSVELAVPCCVAAEGTFAEPIVLRAGRSGETFESLRGPFNLEGKPLLADPEGALGSPITDSVRVKVQEGTERAWMIAYLPRDMVDPGDVRKRLDELLAKAPVAEVELAGVSVAGEEIVDEAASDAEAGGK